MWHITMFFICISLVYGLLRILCLYSITKSFRWNVFFVVESILYLFCNYCLYCLVLSFPCVLGNTPLCNRDVILFYGIFTKAYYTFLIMRKTLDWRDGWAIEVRITIVKPIENILLIKIGRHCKHMTCQHQNFCSHQQQPKFKKQLQSEAHTETWIELDFGDTCFNPSTWEPEDSKFLWIQCQPVLHSEF